MSSRRLRSSSLRLHVPWEVLLGVCQQSDEDVEINTLARLHAFFVLPSSIFPVSRLRPHLGLHRLKNLFIDFENSPTEDFATIFPTSTWNLPRQLLHTSSALKLNVISTKLSTTAKADDLDLLLLINSHLLPSIPHRHNITSVSFFNGHPNPSGSSVALEIQQTSREPEEMIRTSRICDIPLEMVVEVIPALNGGSETGWNVQEWDEVVLTLDFMGIVLKEGKEIARHLREATIALLEEEERWLDGPEIEAVILVSSEDVTKVVKGVVGTKGGKERRGTCRVVKS